MLISYKNSVPASMTFSGCFDKIRLGYRWRVEGNFSGTGNKKVHSKLYVINVC